MKILFVPIDDRPCSLYFPIQLSSMANFDIIIPPKEYLGCFLEPGSPKLLMSWLEKEAGNFDYALLSVDMLLYGGLIASRTTDIDSLDAHTLQLEKWLNKNIAKKIILFSTIMRTLPTFKDELVLAQSEKLKKVLGKLYPKRNISREEIDANIQLELSRNTSYRDILYNSLKAREKKHNLNLKILNWKKKGIIDKVIFGLDDVVGQGPNLYEKFELETVIKDEGLNDCFVCMGTDELPMSAISKIYIELTGIKPHMKVHYSNDSAVNKKTIYENVSVPEIVKGFLNITGLSESDEDDGINIFCHISKNGQKETEFQKINPAGNEEKFAKKIASFQSEGKFVAIADVAFANGSDDRFSRHLLKYADFVNLGGYAGWNTSGNSLGCVMAQSIIRYIYQKHGKIIPESEKAHHIFNFERFIDDWLYQSVVRPKEKLKFILCNKSFLNMSSDEQKSSSLKISEKLKKYANYIFSKKYEGRHNLAAFDNKEIAMIGPLEFSAKLPWARLFEISLSADFSIQ